MADPKILSKLIGEIPNDDKTDIFCPKHTMTNKELLGQAWAFTGEIQKYYLEVGTPVCIGVASQPSNGARIVLGLVEHDSYIGYACTVHAVSKRNKIIEKICDMFEAGPTELSEEDREILINYSKEV